MAKPNLIVSYVGESGESWDAAHDPAFLTLGLVPWWGSRCFFEPVTCEGWERSLLEQLPRL